jgi:hypothetical protein
MAQGAPLHCDAGSCCAAVSLGLCTQQRVVYHSMCPLSPSTLQQGRPPLLPMRLQALPSPANTAMSPPGMMQDTACQLAFQQTPPSKLRPRAMGGRLLIRCAANLAVLIVEPAGMHSVSSQRGEQLLSTC